jgi:hypothetical protein
MSVTETTLVAMMVVTSNECALAVVGICFSAHLLSLDLLAASGTP